MRATASPAMSVQGIKAAEKKEGGREKLLAHLCAVSEPVWRDTA